MEQYYLFLVGILFLFAIVDVVVGVSNDAVNFLSSAIGAKAAPFYVIMIIASLGVIAGAVSSDGMMEIARSGIFIPSMFTFNNIMLIFVGVMITDVLLLDTFNSLGLPTSTTVSIIFELLGGGVMMAIINLNNSGLPASDVLTYINTNTAIKIVTGIFTAVIIAFVFGTLIQWITRLIFSFNYEKKMNTYGALFGGIAITAITYFIVIKGAKHAVFMTPELYEYIQTHTGTMLLYSFGFWTVLMQLLKWAFKINVLKVVVLAGTFALALAFAGNDMVNFIGAPLAGYVSFDLFMQNGGLNDLITMEGLQGKITTPTFFLLIAGMIMVLTLWLSKKARMVTQTTLSLSNQSSGEEQFGSSVFARLIVRHSIRISENVGRFIPKFVKKFVHKRFEQPKVRKKDVSFDLLRASVNLIVASMLITLGTSLKLPLSTTYVTFMVAMGTSLADGAWGRESAVYRITGVFTVIAGWFLTAFIAFTICALIVYVLYIGEMYAVIGLFILALVVLFKTQIFAKRKEAEKKQHDALKLDSSEENLTIRSHSNISLILSATLDVFNQIYTGFGNYSHQELKVAKLKAKELDKNAKTLKDSVNVTIKDIGEEYFEASHNYVQVVDYLREISRSLSFIADPSYSHVSNNHKPLIEIQKHELHEILEKYEAYIKKIIYIIETKQFSQIEDAINEQTLLFEYIQKVRKKQMKRAKTGEVNTRNSLLYLQILHEAKQIISYSMNVLKSHRDLVKAIEYIG
ncbi:MAG: Phosphate transporter family protein [Bacteroidetes bacterium ADurb.Bin217]|nr:MAG: Phosphate transporter family protein [Bacteroidetes bacterium ADurb.Bin217]